MPKEIRFNSPRLLLVEGIEDRFFFARLIIERKLPLFKILHSGLTDTRQGGNSLFGRALSVLKQIPSFNAVHHVLIVSDNDTSQADSFALVCQRLLAKGINPPASIGARSQGHPTIEIMMLPLADQPGNLESVCCPAAQAARPAIASSVKDFQAVVKADKWPPEKADKMWLRAYLSVCEKDPFVPLGSVFSERPFANLIDFKDPSFDPIANVLESYR